MFAIKYLHHKIVRALLIFTVFSLAATTQANTLTASVNRDTLALQETLTLIISADEQTTTTPDISSLNTDFDILSTSRSSSIKVINGNTESSTDWHITLAPKRAGTLLIPSFNINNAVSDAIEIKVSEQLQHQTGSHEPIYVAVETQKKTVFVQEQILLTIKLISEVNLSQAEMQPLDLKNALVINVDQQQYQTTINGKPHLIVETSFAIFPQESGDIVIPSLTYNVAVDDSRNGFDPFGRNRNNIVRLRTTEQHITVKPVPAENANKHWQPANQLTLSETWSNSLDHLKVGEPVTRTITINTDGLSGGQISPLTNNTIDGLTFYPDQAQTKDTKNAKGVQGTRVETIAIIPNHGGDFTLPEINVDWWDNNSQSIKTATLPAKTIHVAGDALAPLPQQIIQTQPKVTADTDVNKTDVPTLSLQTPNPLNPWLWATSIIFALLAAALAVYAWQLKAYIAQLQQAHEDNETELSENEKDILDVLKHAAANKDAAALRKAILQWAKFQWPTQATQTLDDIAKLAMKDELTAAFKQLDELLYSNHSTTEWDANALLTLLRECKKERKNKKTTPELKPLYTSK